MSERERAREKLERERDVLRNCQFHNQNELHRADAEIGDLRAEVERLRALMARILEEPSNTMSDGKALREIIRMVKAQTAIDAARKPEPRMWYSKKDDPTSWNTDPDSGEAG